MYLISLPARLNSQFYHNHAAYLCDSVGRPMACHIETVAQKDPSTVALPYAVIVTALLVCGDQVLLRLESKMYTSRQRIAEKILRVNMNIRIIIMGHWKEK